MLKPSSYPDMVFRPTAGLPNCKQKLNEINILEQMLSLMQY